MVAELGTVANRDVARALGVSAATSHRLLNAFVVSGVLERVGKGRAARYRLSRVRHRFELAGLDESDAWDAVERDIAIVRPLAPEWVSSLRYAASEVINNAIDHSDGTHTTVTVEFRAGPATEVVIRDDGRGVFQRICDDFAIATPYDAIVELEKGKLSSDPSRHSGEGLFFSSKAVSAFRLESQGVAWVVDGRVDDSSIASSDVTEGTSVTLLVEKGKVPNLEEVFAAYTNADDFGFDTTRLSIKLSGVGRALISRSQGKRVVARLESFRHVVLDFSGVDLVGQGFCDEVFRIFAKRRPEVEIEPVGMSDPIAFMVARARAAARIE